MPDMDFDLTDLRLFLLAAGELNLTRAAARQHLSLAAASGRIKALEAQCGVALFKREARGLKLTVPGEAFLHHARGMLRQVQELGNDLHDYAGGARGHLRVYANTTAVSDFLPEILDEDAVGMHHGSALFEYLLQVPANRIGYTHFNVGQLKIMQEVITLTVFVPFAIFYLDQPFKLDYLWAGLCMVGAVYFIFRG